MARSTFALMGTRILSVLIGVALSVLLARWLAPEGYGTYLFTLTVAQFLAMPILAGLPTLVVREVAITRGDKDADGLAGILRWSLGFILVTSLVVAMAGGLFLLLRDTGKGDPSVLFIAIPLVLALAFLQLGSAIVQAHEHPFAGNLGDGLLRPGLLLGLVSLAAIIGGLDAGTVLWMHVAAAAAAAGFAFGYWYLVCRDRQPSGGPLVPRYEKQKWLASLWPLSLVTAAGLINKRLDILMLGLLTLAEDVARYGIAVQLASLVVMGQTIVNSIVGPKIARLYRQADHENLCTMITRGARLSATIALVVFLAIFLLGAQVIEMLLGKDYSAAWLIALILCGGNLFSGAMGPVSKVMSMTGNERIMARLVWMSAFANGALNLLLVPVFGAVGAAIATVTAQLIHQVSMVWWVSSRLRIDTTVIGRRMPAE